MTEPNQREITEMRAWQIANSVALSNKDDLPRLQTAIRASIQAAIDLEREACAKIAMDMRARWLEMSGLVASVSEDAAGKIAEAIRDRNEQ